MLKINLMLYARKASLKLGLQFAFVCAPENNIMISKNTDKEKKPRAIFNKYSNS